MSQPALTMHGKVKAWCVSSGDELCASLPQPAVALLAPEVPSSIWWGSRINDVIPVATRSRPRVWCRVRATCMLLAFCFSSSHLQGSLQPADMYADAMLMYGVPPHMVFYMVSMSLSVTRRSTS